MFADERVKDYEEELNDYTDGQGTVSYTRKEFEERAKIVQFFEKTLLVTKDENEIWIDEINL